MKNIYGTRIRKNEIPEDMIKYLGVNPQNGKTVMVLSGGHLSPIDNFQIFAPINGRWLMQVINIKEVKENVKADYYYVCD